MGGVGGLPWRPSMRSNPSPAEEHAKVEVDVEREVDALEEDGLYEKCIDNYDEEDCLGGWKDGSIWSWVQTIRLGVVECASLAVGSALAPP